MKKAEFRIGGEFTTEAGRWRCTDIGTRVIVAINIDLPFEIVISQGGVQRSEMSNDPSWFNGPPYAIEEHVFDEHAMPACEPT